MFKSTATFHDREELSIGSAERMSETRRKTGHYKGIAVFIKFVESQSLILSRDNLLELKLVRSFIYNAALHLFVLYYTLT